MKWVMDERLKHRLAGIAVIVSIAAIFVPAVMKKSNQRFETAGHMALKLPPKPEWPEVPVKDKTALFKTVKVAHVEIPAVKNEVYPEETLAKAEPISELPSVKTVITPEPRAPKVVAVKTNPPPAASVRKVVAAKTPVAIPGNAYSVQLATFVQKSNAVALVNRLKSRGYKAYFSQTPSAGGTVYKVYAGRLTKKPDAYVLQQQLASSMRLKGFVVPSTGLG